MESPGQWLEAQHRATLGSYMRPFLVYFDLGIDLDGGGRIRPRTANIPLNGADLLLRVYVCRYPVYPHALDDPSDVSTAGCLLLLCISLSASRAAVSPITLNVQATLPRSASKGSGILLFAIRWQPSRRCAGCHYFTTPLSFLLLGVASLCFCGNHAHDDLQALFFLHLMNLKHISSPQLHAQSATPSNNRVQLGTENIIIFSARCFPKRFAGTV
ncbi:hypothetical protein B0T13DRAFT_300959 [Neurospora crassa]|nr:hypothetical protein B0T13DRAFT_300959 [Neurospora crassa]